MTEPIRIQQLHVRNPDGDTIVHPYSAAIRPGQTLALIGESGSGKTLSAKALVGLLPAGFTASGTLGIDGRSIDLAQSDRAWRPERGTRITLLLQDPFTSLSPVHRIGEQIGWTIDAHAGRRLGKADRTDRIRAALEEVRLDPALADAFPHELSGGMRQRAAIATALASSPSLVIADEPTTALDASNQAEILDLLDRLKRERGLGVLLISHDLGMVRDRSDEILVMRRGEVVDRGPTAELFAHPGAEYTRELLAADPMTTFRRDGLADADAPIETDAVPVLRARGIEKSFGATQVLHGVDLEVRGGELVGIVGESGSGKSTLMRCVAGLEREDAGTIEFDGVAVRPGRVDRTPEQAQIVFQDPYSTLNPMWTVRETLAEALRAVGRPASEAADLLDLVGLDAAFLDRRPARLSGGQRQRVAIARALAPRPRLLICDESVSALDVSVQARILDLLRHLRDELGIAIALVSHDLAVVGSIADRVVVLKDGRVVEEGPANEVFAHPREPYTRMLIAAALGESAPASPTAEADEPTTGEARP